MELIDRFNNVHPRIKFTYDLSCDRGCLDYTDVTIAVQQSSELSYRLFQKPCSSSLLVDYASSVPTHVKLAVAQSQFLRAQRLSSNAQMRAELAARTVGVSTPKGTACAACTACWTVAFDRWTLETTEVNDSGRRPTSTEMYSICATENVDCSTGGHHGHW
eukprot:scpid37582/ scgid34504/ 